MQSPRHASASRRARTAITRAQVREGFASELKGDPADPSTSAARTISSPGMEIGATAEMAKQPALPADVAVPGGRSSTMVTRKPRDWSASAQFTPIIPAPITTTCCGVGRDTEGFRRANQPSCYPEVGRNSRRQVAKVLCTTFSIIARVRAPAVRAAKDQNVSTAALEREMMLGGGTIHHVSAARLLRR